MIRFQTLFTVTAATSVLLSCASSGPTGAPAEASPPTDTGRATAAPAPAAPAAAAGVFTEDQAGRGRSTFRSTCSACHYSSEFHGSDFQYKWGRRTVGDLFKNVSENMPDDAPGSLSESEYVDVVAYILQLNGFAAGSMELNAEADAMQSTLLEAPSGVPPKVPETPVPDIR